MITPTAFALYYAALGAAAHDLRRGVRESRENAGKEVDHMLKNAGITVPAPWCAAFVQDCTDSASSATGLRNPLDDVKLEALVASYVEWAKQKGKVCTMAAQAKPGYLVAFNFGGVRWDHIAIVTIPPTDDQANAVFQTIEGNSNDSGSREGDKVVRKTRHVIPGRTLFIAWAE